MKITILLPLLLALPFFLGTLIFSLKREDTDLEQHFKGIVNNEFVEIKKLKPLKAISQNDINLLLSRPNDIDLWLQHIPPENFEFVIDNSLEVLFQIGILPLQAENTNVVEPEFLGIPPFQIIMNN
ncbi:MAG: hypothetical protein AAGA85_21320, partial [Bacteroidota bacterium]